MCSQPSPFHSRAAEPTGVAWILSRCLPQVMNWTKVDPIVLAPAIVTRACAGHDGMLKKLLARPLDDVTQVYVCIHT